MQWSFVFFLNSIMLGVGLAMDAFSVSLANGLNERHMSKRRMCKVAYVFGGFQTIMPLIGWFCVHTMVKCFCYFEKFIPWIALILLLFIGGKMIKEGMEESDANEKETVKKKLSLSLLLVQGVATSIDALSVGFTIADYSWIMALVSTLIIGMVTFVICMAGIIIGKKFGTIFANKASIFGGIILVIIGIEIFVTGVF